MQGLAEASPACSASRSAPRDPLPSEARTGEPSPVSVAPEGDGGSGPAAHTSLSVQYLSDVHLETRSPAEVEAEIGALERHAPILILGGDIGNPAHPSYFRFLAAAAARFDLVVLIAGNHEFYGSSLEETVAEIRALVRSLPNVVFLHNERHSSPALPVHIFGGTMWSDVLPEEQARVEAILSDHARILGFDAAASRNEHAVFVDLLEAELRACEGDGKPFLVVSHHLPLRRLVDARYAGSPINSAFASDVRLAEDARVAAWFYGHTHVPRHGPRFFCNPRGYPGEREAGMASSGARFAGPQAKAAGAAPRGGPHVVDLFISAAGAVP
jgi:predicted phosphodiesterase